MKSITYAAILITVLCATTAHAKSLDEARAIEAQIEQATNGRIHVLGDKANDELYQNPTAVANLNEVLRNVLNNPRLNSMSPEEVGDSVVISLALVTQYSKEERQKGGRLQVFVSTEETKNFCKLAAEPFNLFSPQISNTICGTETGKTTDLPPNTETPTESQGAPAAI